MLVPLAEALGLSVLELLQGEQSAPCDSEGAARLALDSVQQVQGWKRQERWRQYICAVLGVGALVLWLAVCGLISLPANRTCLAWVYQDGQQQELTLVHWSGTLQFRLPLRWEFRGQIQTPLAQTTLDPDRELHLALPLTWDKATSLSHQSWNGNIREQEGPFLSAPFYLDWWGGEFAFSLSDGTIIASSSDACTAWTQEFGEKASASP